MGRFARVANWRRAPWSSAFRAQGVKALVAPQLRRGGPALAGHDDPLYDLVADAYVAGSSQRNRRRQKRWRALAHWYHDEVRRPAAIHVAAVRAPHALVQLPFRGQRGEDARAFLSHRAWDVLTEFRRRRGR